MNALQPSRPPLKPVEPRRVASQRKNRNSRPSYQVMAVQTTAKLTINILLSAVAVSALVKLVPYYLSQQEKLQEIQTEIKLTEERVNSLRTDFNRYFDPQQAKSIMQEQSNRVDPGQRPVILMNKPVKVEQQVPSH